MLRIKMLHTAADLARDARERYDEARRLLANRFNAAQHADMSADECAAHGKRPGVAMRRYSAGHTLRPPPRIFLARFNGVLKLCI